MTPIEFKGFTHTLAKNQPEYRPFPVFMDADGVVVSCWKLTFKERLKVLFHGVFFLQVLTFGTGMQPQLPSVENPLVFPNEKE